MSDVNYITKEKSVRVSPEERSVLDLMDGLLKQVANNDGGFHLIVIVKYLLKSLNKLFQLSNPKFEGINIQWSHYSDPKHAEEYLRNMITSLLTEYANSLEEKDLSQEESPKTSNTQSGVRKCLFDISRQYLKDMSQEGLTFPVSVMVKNRLYLLFDGKVLWYTASEYAASDLSHREVLDERSKRLCDAPLHSYHLCVQKLPSLVKAARAKHELHNELLEETLSILKNS